MSLLSNVLSAFKGGEPSRMPLAPGFLQGWMPAFEAGSPVRHFDYHRAVREGFLANQVAQRAVRIVAEGVGQTPLASSDPKLTALVTATSAGQSMIETLAAQVETERAAARTRRNRRCRRRRACDRFASRLAVSRSDAGRHDRNRHSNADTHCRDWPRRP